MTIESKDSFDADGIPDDEMLGGATFVEAVIHAESVEPENEHVKYIKEHGLADVERFAATMPECAQKWIVRESNQYMKGSTSQVHKRAVHDKL